MTKDTRESVRAKLVIMKYVAEYGEEIHYHLSGDNLRNLEAMFRESAKDIVEAQKAVLSGRDYKHWRKQMKELYSLAE